MALIYLLHNLIKVSARNELIESSSLPWILLSSLQHSHRPKHPAPSPAPHSGSPLIHVFPRQERLILYLLPSMPFCRPRCRAAPAQLAEECMQKKQPHPPSRDIVSFFQAVEGVLVLAHWVCNPTVRRSRLALGNPGLGTSGICLCQSKAIIGPHFREEKEITYLQKHLSNQ